MPQTQSNSSNSSSPSAHSSGEPHSHLPPAISIRGSVDRVVVTVKAPKAIGLAHAANQELLLARLFAVEGVHRVSIDPRKHEAEIELSGALHDRSLLNVLASALRGEMSSLPQWAIPPVNHARPLSVTRFGGRLTAWEVASNEPGFLRLRNDLVRRDRTVSTRIERMLSTTEGIVEATFSAWTGSLVVRYDSALLSAEAAVALAENARCRSGSTQGSLSLVPGVGASMMLGVAVLADFVFPILAPVSILLLLGNNLGTFARATGEISTRRLGVSTLITVIIGTTLVTGQYTASALMTFCFDFWRRRYRRDLVVERALLLEDLTSIGPGSQSFSDIASLVQGNRIRLISGDVVPADCLIEQGSAMCDERMVRGTRGVTQRIAGEQLLAGTLLLDGEVHLLVQAVALQTRAASIAREVISAITSTPGVVTPTASGELYAQGAVVPTLATAAVGFLAGDVTTAAAILRPDYATGVGVASSMEDIAAVTHGLSRGILIRHPGALDTLALSDRILLVDDDAIRHTGLRLLHIEAPAESADEMLRLAASIAMQSDDPRTAALAKACRERGIVLVNRMPIDFRHGITVRHGRHLATLLTQTDGALSGNLQNSTSHPMVLSLDGRVAATFRFTASDEPLVVPAILSLLSATRSVELVSNRGELEAHSFATTLGIPCTGVALNAETLSAQVSGLAGESHRVVVIGPRSMISKINPSSAVMIETNAGEDLSGSPAAIVMLTTDLSQLSDLFVVAQGRRERRSSSLNLALIPNMACVAGAFLFGFTALIAVIVSNLGTLGSYSLASKRLKEQQRLAWVRNRRGLPSIPRTITRVDHIDHVPQVP